MKSSFKLLALVSVAVLGSQVAQAASLDETLATDPAAAFASKNYERLHENDDGRVTIVGPKFGSADGTVRWISSSSNHNGVCALFGFGASIDAGKLNDGVNHARTIQIDGSGMFSAFRESGNGYINSRITSIVCENVADTKVSTRVHQQPIVNDDGTITLLHPSFGFVDGSDRWISSTSDLNGVCKRFGFGNAVASSLLIEGNHPRTIKLDQAGKFTQFRESGNGYLNTRIVSVICRPAGK